MQHYRAPFVERAARKPIAGVAARDSDRRRARGRRRGRVALSRRLVPVAAAEALFTVEPGMLVPAPLVAWCRASLPKLDVIALGRGLHFVQEDHPHAIGEHSRPGCAARARAEAPSLVEFAVSEGEIMAQQKCLVTGATGGHGRLHGRAVVERGQAVRALAHREDDRSKRLGKMGRRSGYRRFSEVQRRARGDARSSRRILLLFRSPRHSAGAAYFAQAAKEAGLECS